MPSQEKQKFHVVPESGKFLVFARLLLEFYPLLNVPWLLQQWRRLSRNKTDI